MTLTAFAIQAPDAFVDLVKKLRAAGVVKLGALVIGPEPRDAAVHEPVDPLAAARRKHDVMFAASSIKPPFVAPVAPDGGAPRAIVQRRERDEAADGTSRPTR